MRIVLSIVLLALCGGCALLGPGTPGVGRHVFPEGTGAAERYAALRWYEEINGSLPEESRELFDAAARELRAAWMTRLVEENSAYLEMVNGQPSVRKAIQCKDASSALVDVIRLEKQLGSSLQGKVSLEQPGLWNGAGSRLEARYREWCQKQRELSLEYGDEAWRAKAVADISVLRRALEACRHFDAVLSESDGVSGKEGFRAALSKVCEAEKAYSEYEGRLEGVSFKERAKTVKARLSRGVVSSLIAEYGSQIRSLKSGKPAELARVEQGMHAKLSRMAADSKYVAALEAEKPAFEKMVREIGGHRVRLGSEELQRLETESGYWRECRRYVELVKSLEDSPGIYGMYPDVKAWMLKELGSGYFTRIAALYAKHMPQVTGAWSVNGRAGAGYALGTCLNRLLEVPGEMPESLRMQRGALRLQLDILKRHIEDKVLPRTFKVGEMTSAMPGVGLVYSRDLHGAVEKALKMMGLDRFVKVAAPDSPGEILQWSYATYSGLLAEFKGDEMVETEHIRTLRRYGEARAKLNPEYVPNAAAGSSRKQMAQYVYYQDLVTQAVHVREVERQAHIRLSSIVLHGPGCPREPLELNEIYRKRFVQEYSNPVGDVTVRTETCYDKSETRPASPEPELRSHRIWSAGEMLDWGRRESLAMMSLMLAYYINDYPLHLSRQAAAAATLEEKADLLGVCYVLSQAPVKEWVFPELASAGAPELRKQYEAQARQLAELRKNLPERLMGIWRE